MRNPLSRPSTFSRHALFGWLAVVLVALVASPAGAGAQEEDSDGTSGTGNEGLPLEVDRRVPIDMTEGSWISLDVSPDGETIVFDYLGDLFTIPVTGGDATQLTSGMPFDAQPRVLPRRFAHRLHVGRRRRTEHLGPLPRRLGDEAGFEGRRQPRRVARVDAGRRLRGRRPGRLPRPRAAEAQAVPRRGRQRDPAGVRARQFEDGRTGGVARRTLHLVHPADRRLDLQRAVPAVPVGGLRHRDGRALHAVVALRLGHSAHAVARRALARLRHPARRSHRARAAGIWSRARSAGSPIPCSTTTRNRGRRWTCCPGCRSPPTPPTWSPPTAGRSGSCRSRGGEAEEIPFRVQFDPRARAAGGLRLPHRRHRRPSRSARSATRRPPRAATAWRSRRWIACGCPARTGRAPSGSPRPTCPSTSRRGRRTETGSRTPPGTATPATSTRRAQTAAATPCA